MQPFSSEEDSAFLDRSGITYGKSVFSSDVLLSHSLASARLRLLRHIFFWKKFLVWTNEPRFDTTPPAVKARNVRVMNVYSGDVFWHNLHFLGAYHNSYHVNLGIDIGAFPGRELSAHEVESRPRFCAAVFSYRDPGESALYIDGQDVDLNARRQSLALELYRRGLADISGKDWPSEVEIIENSGWGFSGSGHWWTRKLELLQQYRFNLCYENTVAPHYCTEKIWHAIAAGCLPIYYGKGTRIYDTFPRGSFIDGSEYESNEALIEFLLGLSPAEHALRYNQCLGAMRKACAAKAAKPDWRLEIIWRFARKVRELCQ